MTKVCPPHPISEIPKPSHASTMNAWLELPDHLLEVIVGNLCLTDMMRFSLTCKCWRSFSSSLLPPNVLLWLIIPLDSNVTRSITWNQNLGFQSLQLAVHELNAPNIQNRRICGSCEGGWIITLHENGEVQAFNPFSKALVHFPSLSVFPGIDGPLLENENYVYRLPEFQEESVAVPSALVRDHFLIKAVLSSSDPTHSHLLAIYGESHRLAVCKPGEGTGWRILGGYSDHSFEDVAVYKNLFYGVHTFGIYSIEGIDTNSPELRPVIPMWKKKKPSMPKPVRRLDKHYLVECVGDLLLVERCLEQPDNLNLGHFKTCSFKIRKVGFASRKWTTVADLGENQSLFIGINHGFSISSLDYSGCKGNCIYFTDDSIKQYIGKSDICYDIGIFDIETKEITYWTASSSRFKVVNPPPVWYLVKSLHTKYQMLQADDGGNQEKGFASATHQYSSSSGGEMNPFAEQEAWEEHQIGKPTSQYGSKNRKETDRSDASVMDCDKDADLPHDPLKSTGEKSVGNKLQGQKKQRKLMPPIWTVTRMSICLMTHSRAQARSQWEVKFRQSLSLSLSLSLSHFLVCVCFRGWHHMMY